MSDTSDIARAGGGFMRASLATTGKWAGGLGVVGGFIDKAVFKNEEGRGMGYFVTVMVLEILFGILASLIVMWFSRQREFRADAAGARLAGTNGMIGALEALKRAHEPEPLPEKMAAFGINGGTPTGFKRLFMTHPPLEERIAALKAAQ